MPYQHQYQLLERLYTSPRTLTSRALRSADQRTVIIKSPASPYPTPSQLARFRFGCELQKSFDHPGIAKVLDCMLTGASYYMVLEDIGAMSLGTYLEHQPDRRVGVDLFLPLARQIIQALSVVHSQQVVHKDLHAGNVLINPHTLQIQINDFDLSSLLAREEPSLQPPASTEGVLGFVSPEQTGRMNRSIDYRTDYYTMGVLFYLMLSGHMPFEDESPIALVHAHIARLAMPLDQRVPGLPSMLARIVDKLMAKNTDDRYQSTAGLLADIGECERQWRNLRRIDPFPLAQSDYSERLQVSQTLYGRRDEIARLMEAFSRAQTGHTQLLTIAGYSGIGKSSLVQEAHKPVALHGGWFIAGKCQSMTRNIPFASLSEALREWVQQVLAEPPAIVQLHARELRERLGSNARLLIELQAEFALLLGELPPLTTLASTEAKLRLQAIMQQFFAYAADTHPLVLFLDDLQWADVDTLELLELIARQPRLQLLLVLAWRDNEVSEGHLSLQCVRTLERILAAEQRQHLTLTPLNIDALKQLLSDTLRMSSDRRDTDELDALAQLIKDKTDGNPFFVGEFLRRLHQDGLLYVDHQHRRWEWNLAQIRASHFTDNVVELMLDNMRRLPLPTQTLMQWAACLGSRFDLATLAIVTGITHSVVQQQLWPAIHAGVLLPESGEWNASYATLEGPLALLDTLASRIFYRFLHDRMLQAAYESMDETPRQQHHRQIGQLLQQTCLPDQPELIFKVVEHFNLSRCLISNDDERLALAALNLDAAQRAKTASAWPAAAHHVATAQALLPNDAWQTQYALAARTALLNVECEFLMARAESAQAIAEAALPCLQTNIDKARICLLLLNGFIGRDKLDYAIAKGIDGLRYCGIEIPPVSQLKTATQQEKRLIASTTHHQPLSSIMTFSEQSNADDDLVCALFAPLFIYTYVAGDVALREFLSFRSLRYLMEFGVTPSRLNTLAYAMPMLLHHQLFDECQSLVQAAWHFAEDSHDLSARSQFFLAMGTLVWGYYRPFNYTIETLHRGQKDAVAAGNTIAAFGCLSNITFQLYAKGEELDRVTAHLSAVDAMLNTHKIVLSAGKQYARLVGMLQHPDQPNQLDDAAFSPQEHSIMRAGSVFGTLQHLRLQWAFWSEDYAAGIALLPTAATSLIHVPSCAPGIDHPLLEGLLIARNEQTDRSQRQSQVAALRSQMQTRGAYNSHSFEHKIDLLLAEEARLADNIESTLTHYQKAIETAQRDGFLQYQALANELLGELLHQKGWPTLAEKALRDAYYLYGRWGCTIKQRRMAERHAWLLQTDTAQTISIDNDTSEQGRRSSGQKTSTQLDLESLLKSVRAISGELRLTGLIHKLLHIILENAGAQRAALILANNDRLDLAAQVSSDDATEIAGFHPEPIDTQDSIPNELVRYVISSAKPWIIQNVATEGCRFNADYFAARRPQSVLCVPILYRDRPSGALYLENTLTPHAFGEARLQLLQMLLAQAAIALENARLFSEVEHFNLELEQKIEQRTAELRAANQELQSFSYSVSHDLRNPLRNIGGFTRILLDEHANTPEAQDLLQRILRNTEKMTQLIAGLLALSRVVSSELVITQVNLSTMAESIADDLKFQYPTLAVDWVCARDVIAQGDERLLYAALENLLNNAWKYSSKKARADIEFGVIEHPSHREYFVRDRGAGFDMQHASKLFMGFQRLHSDREFSGSGIGLSTVQRIIKRHGGSIRAESAPGQGATFYFTLGERPAAALLPSG